MEKKEKSLKSKNPFHPVFQREKYKEFENEEMIEGAAEFVSVIFYFVFFLIVVISILLILI